MSASSFFGNNCLALPKRCRWALFVYCSFTITYVWAGCRRLGWFRTKPIKFHLKLETVLSVLFHITSVSGYKSVFISVTVEDKGITIHCLNPLDSACVDLFLSLQTLRCNLYMYLSSSFGLPTYNIWTHIMLLIFAEALQLLQENGHSRSRTRRAAFSEEERKIAGVSTIAYNILIYN